MEHLQHSFIYLGSAIALLAIAVLVFRRTHPKVDYRKELTEKDNPAFGLSLTGYLAGIIAVIYGAIEGPSNGLRADLIDITTYGLLGIALLRISQLISDRLIFNRVDLKTEIIRDKNWGAGLIQGAMALGMGMVIYGAISGENHLGMNGVVSSVLFWAIGMLLLTLTLKIYFAWIPFKIQDEVEQDNMAVGIALSGVIIAIANLLRFGLHGDFHGWIEFGWEMGFEFILGILLLPVARIFTDKVLLPGKKLSAEITQSGKPNMAAGVLEAFGYIGSSLLLILCL